MRVGRGEEVLAGELQRLGQVLLALLARGGLAGVDLHDDLPAEAGARDVAEELRGADRANSSISGTMVRSEGVNPGRSTFVESLNSASTPSFPYLANACRSNGTLSTGV